MTYNDPGEVARRIAAAARGRPVLVLLDFDGTLCEFQPEPGMVWLQGQRRAVLQQLIAHEHMSAGFVSGRRLADLRERVGLTGEMWFAGLHGLEIDGFGRHFVHERVDEARGLLGLLARALRTQTADLPGVLIEDKELSLAVHVRKAHPDDKIKADAAFLRMALPHIDDRTLRLMPGSNVSELLPNIPWTKGDAVRWIHDAERDRRGVDPCVIYLGDDVTDEDAFKEVGPGSSIMVGPRPSLIETRLENPAAVEAFLSALVKTV
ncbi:MAG: trehalose-phosphatase [Vicinamibacterales bacterium]